MRSLHLTRAEIDVAEKMWRAGISINTICQEVGHGTVQIRRLADEEGWPSRTPRDPLPAGDPHTWGLLIQGTILEGTSFRQVA